MLQSKPFSLRVKNIFLFAGVLICLLQIWLPQYFLTGDGPCHIYNAKILHDWWSHQNVAFYKQFYKLNNEPNPNWLTHLTLASLLYFFDGATSEKIFLSAYVLLFVPGYFLLLRKISNKNIYWPLVVLVFVFHHPLIKGFYNFTLSIAFFFWIIWCWLMYLENRRASYIVLLFLFTALTFFTHPLAFGYSLVVCFSLLLSHSLSDTLAKGIKKFSSYIVPFVVLSLVYLPFLLLLEWYTSRHGGINFKIQFYGDRTESLIRFHYLVNRSRAEELFTLITGLVILVYFIILLFVRFIKEVRINKYDGLLIGLLFGLIVYFMFPDFMLGGGLLIMRAQLFVFLLICCCIVYITTKGIADKLSTIIVYSCFVALSIVRIPGILSASSGLSEYLSAGNFIKPKSVVLPLSFNHNGKDENGKLIASSNWIFQHAFEYAGTKKPLIMLGNYEANTGYFPLIWKDNVNPYKLLSKDESIEGQPPYAAISDYAKAGVKIDYIVMWCYENSYMGEGHVKQLFQQINRQYHLIYASSTKRVLLFEHNK